MSEIPSHIASSAAQSGYQAKEVSKEREAGKAGAQNINEKRVRAADEAGNTVDADDADTAVFTDSEGQGSQGRAFDSATDESTDDQEEQAPADGDQDSDDGDSESHLDIEV
ncbi:MAG: hypothetical protein ACYTHJ_08400 [Planctomycetota bacterium]|jgi:hypothetical protein